ncbi:unnamed protein product [Ambrosiozyma monospora]|uniref:Signal peptidase complex subunit 1 n=1 Tax=Ambrosiozyma monospora TaxID=43982 RepID=A0A9W6W7V0_AMBMO|nr:unnamed protein product [Ambrosiozyma monospora]GMG55858.1 unnamed protein product [Ambrosiozyma monospora]
MDQAAAYFQENIAPALAFNIDFKGQEKVTSLCQLITIIFSVIAFALGFILQDVLVTGYVMAVGTVILLVIALPAYPAYNKNPVTFLKPAEVKLPDLGSAKAVDIEFSN